MAQQSWLGNIWDAITGRDKEPAGNGLMSSLSEDPEAISWGNLQPVQRSVPEYARNLGETWANMGEGSLLALRGAVADVPAAVAGAYTAFGPEAGLRRPGEGRIEAFGRGFTEAKQAQPIGLLREGYEELSAQTQPFSFGDMSQQDRMMARETGAPLGLAEAAAIPTAARAVRGAANVAANALERSPVGQGILAMQEQRGMTPEGILGVSRMTDQQPSRLGEKQPIGLFSALETAARDLPQQKGSGQQMLAMIQKQGGVKPEEVQWTGLDEFLKSKPTVTKGEIEDYLLNNRVELQEVRLGEAKAMYDAERARLGQKLGSGEITAQEFRRLTEDLDARFLDDKLSPKFGQYTLPGGENYREVLLTLPVNREAYAKSLVDPAVWSRMTEEQRQVFMAGEIRGDNKTVFRSSHYNQPNILAHVRLNDRIDADGKKVLFVEEVQSDWHQAGRKQGYVGDVKRYVAYYDTPEGPVEIGFGKTAEEAIADADPGWNRLVEIKTRPEKITKDDGYGVPDAPFKKNWHELSVRRILQEAAEKGYDRVTFTTGRTQAERYDLSKQVSTVMYIPRTKSLRAFGHDGEALIAEDGVTPEKLVDYIGKEPAEKLLASEQIDASKFPHIGKNVTGHVLEGEDLKVGGEGMKGFYDNMMVKAFNKEGKKFDAKVGTTNLQTGDEVWSMDITPKMRKTAKEQGMPLFSAAPAIPGAGLLADQEDKGENRPMRSLMDF